jgi:phosphoenolpyruvate synthase/pyruvate phosphate dikinase
MIIAKDEKGRRAALDKLLPYQRSDFKAMYTVLKDRPMTVRLLDPPLHEFLPKTEEDIRDLLTYGKLDDEDIYFPKGYDGIFSCTEEELVVGKRYLFCEHCDGYKHLYRLDTLRARLNGWIDWLERR